MQLGKKMLSWKPLLISIAVSVGGGALVGILTAGCMDYERMYRPPLSPPGWVFPVAWTLWYLLMGIAAYRIVISETAQKSTALQYYGLQLIVNLFWPFLFFCLRLYLVAFVWLLFLIYLIVETIRSMRKIDPIAAALMLPYLVWCVFAAYLNLAIAIQSLLFG